jgi:hypothetical protein
MRPPRVFGRVLNMKIIRLSAVWILALCAALVSPVVVIFGMPLAIGIGTDIIEAGGGPIAAVAIASALAVFGLRKSLGRGITRPLLRWPCRPAPSISAAVEVEHKAGGTGF